MCGCVVAFISGVTNDVLTGAASFNKTHVQVCVFFCLVDGYRLGFTTVTSGNMEHVELSRV